MSDAKTTSAFGKTALLITAVATACLALRMAMVYDDLPDTIATHFSGDGTADGFGPKANFFTTFFGVHLFVQGLLLGSALLIHRIPTALLNIPEKERWIQGGKIETARTITRGGLLELAAGAGLLLFAIFELTLDANRHQGGLNASQLWLVLLVYGGHALWVSFRLLRRLKRPPR